MSTREEVPSRLDRPAEATTARKATPSVDVFETKEAIKLLLDLPGVKQEDVHVHAEQGVLSIQATRQPSSYGGALLSERTYTEYHRSFSLPDGVDVQGISAQLQFGVLTLTLPKPGGKPRRIEVHAG